MERPSGDVLVVDDNAEMVEVMTLVLGEAGYSVRSAANGKEALDAVAARRPDLVLLDMLMPVMDGWQCARELRSRYGREVPIVVVTAAEHARSTAAQIGADGVIAKPFDVTLLMEVVAHHIVKTAQTTAVRE